MNPRIKYKIDLDWDTFARQADAFDSISMEAQELRFTFRKDLLGGLARFRKLRRLAVYRASQPCLEEIAALPNLDTLYLAQARASDFTPLIRCQALRHCMIKSATKMTSLSWLEKLAQLESLALEELKRVEDIAPIAALENLKAFAFEGGVHTLQRVKDLTPLEKLPGLEALFLYACRPRCQGLMPLCNIKSLRYLEISGRYTETEFTALRRALPNLKCPWFDDIDQYGSVKAAIKARLAEIRAQTRGQHPRILTDRLEIRGNTVAQARMGVALMTPEEKACLSADWLARLAQPDVDVWTLGFQVWERTTKKPVGKCGFRGPPEADGIVEIAYGIDERHRGKGFATEACGAMTTWAFAQGVRLVRAHTMPEWNASARVLAKNGFEPAGKIIDSDDGLVWRWEKRPREKTT